MKKMARKKNKQEFEETEAAEVVTEMEISTDASLELPENGEESIVEEITEPAFIGSTTETLVLKTKKMKAIDITPIQLNHDAAVILLTKYLASSGNRKLRASDVIANVPVAYSLEDYLPFIEKHS